MVGPCILKNHFQVQLHLTRGSGTHQGTDGTGALPEVLVTQKTIGVGEVRMIHQVESLGTELHSETLTDLTCF